MAIGQDEPGLGLLIKVSLSVLQTLERYTLLQLFTFLHVVTKSPIRISPERNLPTYSLRG